MSTTQDITFKTTSGTIWQVRDNRVWRLSERPIVHAEDIVLAGTPVLEMSAVEPGRSVRIVVDIDGPWPVDTGRVAG